MVIATAVTAITLPLIGIYEFVGEPRPEVVAVAAPAGAEPFVEAGQSGRAGRVTDSASVTASGDAEADPLQVDESAAMLGGATDDALHLALSGAEAIARDLAAVVPTTAPAAPPSSAPAEPDDEPAPDEQQGGTGDDDEGEGEETGAVPDPDAPATSSPPATAPPSSAAPTTAPPTTAEPTTTTTAPSGSSPIAPFPYKSHWPSVRQWEQMAQCESGGDWGIVSGNGYYGGLQFSEGTWHWMGGSGTADKASKAEQIYRGNLLWESQGWGAWPGCARQLGWL